MGSMSEIIESPLSPSELAALYRQLCEDPRFENVPGKIELDVWGRILMSPANNQHAAIQGRLIRRLGALGGETLAEASVATRAGLLVADVAWLSAESFRSAGLQTPFMRAPELCVEVVSPSSSRKELDEKVVAYLEAGAVEVWIVYPQGKRIERFGRAGPLDRSQFEADLQGLFD
jgi:Uma2 family endonuclease